MFRAWQAYRRVLVVSEASSSSGEMQAIMTVLELPPRLSSRYRVSLLSRYGT